MKPDMSLNHKKQLDSIKAAIDSTDVSNSTETVGYDATLADGTHCDPECKHLEPYGSEYALTALCKLKNVDLEWYDYWLAICK